MNAVETLRLAMQRHQSGQLAEAEALCRQILDAYPDQPDALHLLGVLHYQTGRAGSAVELFQRAIALNPSIESFHCNLGLALAALGQKEQAITTYRRALSLRPDAVVTLVNLAICLHETGDLDAAKSTCQKALAYRKDNADAHVQLGRILRDQGRIDQAIQCYQRALALRPNHALTHYNLGNAYRAAGKAEDAILSYQRTIQLDPAQSGAWCNLGAILCEQGRLEESIAASCRALELRPGFHEAANVLGVALQGQSRWEESIAAHQAALTSQPDFPKAYNDLAQSYSGMGRLDLAIECYARAAKLEPSNARFHKNHGFALFRAERAREALAAYQCALEAAPLDPELPWRLSEAARLIPVSQSEPAGLEKLPYLGDKVVLLRCDRATREQLRPCGLFGGHAIDERDGGDLWLNRQASAGHDARKLSTNFNRWLELARNDAAMAGATCTIWMENMPPSLADALRQAAGADLIEIAGHTCEEIHAALSARAVPPPDTENKIFSVVSIRNDGIELLPHWLDHYTRLGVDEILLGVFDHLDEPCNAEIDRCSQRWKFHKFQQHWAGAGYFDQYMRRQTACRQLGAQPNTWIMHADLDELHEYPAPLGEIIDAASARNIQAVPGHFVDRIAADGSLPPVRPSPRLWEQFPVSCHLTERILRAPTAKVMLSRFSLLIPPGHHEPIGAIASTPLGNAVDYRVAHFKWNADVPKRIRWSLQQPQASPAWKVESRRFLDWLDRHGGKIDLSDPVLGCRI